MAMSKIIRTVPTVLLKLEGMAVPPKRAAHSKASALEILATSVSLVQEIPQRHFGHGHAVGFQGFPNQLAARAQSAIIHFRCRVANEVCDWRLLPLRFLLWFARIHANGIEKQYRKDKCPNGKNRTLTNKI